jgi:1,4-dihydroxy-2-naphthoyl-CoA hydrolase
MSGATPHSDDAIRLATEAVRGTAVAVGVDKPVVGVQRSVNHLRAVRDGHVTATGIPLRVGRSVAVWDVWVADGNGDLVAVGTLTVSIRDP